MGSKMAKTRRPLVAGNWKMNGLGKSRSELKKLIAKMSGKKLRCDALLCPPATLLSEFRKLSKGTRLRLGGQDCHPETAGANTGDISAEMLADAGAAYVIVGHSERRGDHGETDALIQAKASAAHRAGLTAVVCIGESKSEYLSKRTLRVVGSQLSRSLPRKAGPGNLVVAYEPVWAIGTGLTPTVAEIAKVHDYIRKRLVQRFGRAGEGVRILYGGSVKPGNAQEIFAIGNVDGALVGGASLKASDFWEIIRAA